jgi:uncharacterized SAM-binding protein YcdF (DUF218 family)
MFIIKKLISAFLSPVPLCVTLLTIGVILAWLDRARKTRLTFLTAGLLLLVLISSNYFTNFFLGRLEGAYQPLGDPPSGVSAIVVLGGGVRDKVDAPPNTQLGSASLTRLVEGVRLYRALGEDGVEVKFILSGGRVFGSPSDSGMMRNTAVVLGVDPRDMVIENGSQDTYHEALFLKPMLKNQPFLLVTSASHMKRAVELFRAQGMQPIPAPTQYMARKNQFSMTRYFPNATAIMETDIVLHEYAGILWAKINGLL